jgi:hypothetical protein
VNKEKQREIKKMEINVVQFLSFCLCYDYTALQHGELDRVYGWVNKFIELARESM